MNPTDIVDGSTRSGRGCFGGFNCVKSKARVAEAFGKMAKWIVENKIRCVFLNALKTKEVGGNEAGSIQWCPGAHSRRCPR